MAFDVAACRVQSYRNERGGAIGGAWPLSGDWRRGCDVTGRSDGRGGAVVGGWGVFRGMTTVRGMTLPMNGDVFAPAPLGHQNILIGGGTILWMGT